MFSPAGSSGSVASLDQIDSQMLLPTVPAMLARVATDTTAIHIIDTATMYLRTTLHWIYKGKIMIS